MIVREIVRQPGLIETFDWFNDYDDTRRYLSAQGETELLHLFDRAFKRWLARRNLAA